MNKQIHHQLDNIQINYILSKNRSGSTLLSNLLNTHPNLLSVTEMNIYWLLKKEYGHITHFSHKIISQFLNDLFFILETPGRISYLFVPSKEKLFELITNHNESLSYLDLCKLISINTLFNFSKKGELHQIINKEIQFSHLIEKLNVETKNTKFIILSRDPITNIRSSINRKMGRTNCIYQAKNGI